MVAVGPGAAERLADGLCVLRGEQYPQNLSAIAAMLQNFLADELPLAVAIGGVCLLFIHPRAPNLLSC